MLDSDLQDRLGRVGREPRGWAQEEFGAGGEFGPLGPWEQLDTGDRREGALRSAREGVELDSL